MITAAHLFGNMNAAKKMKILSLDYEVGILAEVMQIKFVTELKIHVSKIKNKCFSQLINLTSTSMK